MYLVSFELHSAGQLAAGFWNNFQKLSRDCLEFAGENGSGAAFEKDFETVLNLLCNSPGIAWKRLGNCLRIDGRLLWNCYATARKLPG